MWKRFNINIQVILLFPVKYFVLFVNCNSNYTLFFDNIRNDLVGKGGVNYSSVIVANKYNGSNACIEPGHNITCSGHGYCQNGFCKCDNLKSQKNSTDILYEYEYVGKYCEECPYCKGQRCLKLWHYVEDIAQNLSVGTDSNIYYNFIDEIIINNYKEKNCQVEDSSNCLVKFKYFYDESNNVFIEINKHKECLDGRKVVVLCWFLFLIYIIALMVILKFL